VACRYADADGYSIQAVGRDCAGRGVKQSDATQGTQKKEIDEVMK
jgi:hypothetical protein